MTTIVASNEPSVVKSYVSAKSMVQLLTSFTASTKSAAVGISAVVYISIESAERVTVGAVVS